LRLEQVDVSLWCLGKLAAYDVRTLRVVINS
jgi:hypothetical protein